MALNPTYSVGTVSVSAGSAIVNGDGTLFVAGGLRAGDVFERDGLSVTLAETPDSNTQLTLVKPWPGVTGSGAYEVRYTSDASRVIGAARDIVARTETLPAEVGATTLVAARARDAAGLVPQQFGDGSSGWQNAINQAINTLSLAGGGKLVLPALATPYEISSPIIVRSKVEVDFGKAAIRLANGANCDILQTAGFYTLAGSNNYAVNGSPNGFTLTGGVFDGNRANQGPSDADNCNGLSVYGYGFTLKDMEFRNIRGNGYRGEWGQFGGESVGHSMESTIENLRFDTSGRRGFWYKGPHDANISHIIVVDASQEADDTYDGILNEGYGGARWYNPHVWHRSAATNRARWAGNFAGGGNEILGGHFEGCRRQYRTTGNNQAFGVQLYAPRSDNAQIELSGERNILFGRFANSTQNRRPVVLSLGDTTTAGLSNVELVAGVGAGTTNPVVRVVASVGNNKIRVQATGAATPSTFFTGSFDDFDEVHLHQEFPARVAYRKLPFIAAGTAGRPDPAAPGQYHFDTSLGRPIWRNGAGTAWVDANGTTI